MKEEMIANSRRQVTLVVAVVVAAILLMTVAGVAMTRTGPADQSEPISGQVDKEFTIWARQFDFVPAVITVGQGDHVRVNFKSADVTHGFYIDGYGVNVKVNGGQTESVDFIADQAGTFKFRCSVTCGPFHPFMAGKFVVRQSPNIMSRLIIVGAIAVSALSVGLLALQLWWRNRKDGVK